MQNLQTAWELARQNITKTQKKEKHFYDRHTRKPTYRVGQRVFVYTPSARSGPAYKFALPYKGPVRLLRLQDNVADVQPVDLPTSDILRVSQSRL